MLTRPLDSEELPIGCAVAGTDFSECLQDQQSYPDLFLGLFDSRGLLGVCYGWPVMHEREHRALMRLEVIAITPALRRRGYGKELLESWERQVLARGEWTIDVGSAADHFFLRCGYVPVEYCFKISESQWQPPRLANIPTVISYVHREANQTVVYVKVTGGYSGDVKDKLATEFQAHGAITIFRKQLKHSDSSADPGRLTNR